MLNTSPRRAAAPAPCPVGDLGPNSRLIEEPEIRTAAFLEKFYRDRVFYLEGIEAAAQEKLQLIEENVPRCPNLACKAVVAAEFSRERITSAIGELGEVDNDQREARKFCGDGLRIILRFKKKPERLRALPRLLAGFDRGGAGNAPNRKIALRGKRMSGQAVRLQIGRNLWRAPMRERIDFDARAIGLEERKAFARMRLKAFAAADPGAIALERSRERQDLAQLAAAVGIARPEEILSVLFGKLHRVRLDRDGIRQAKARDELAAIGKGLGKQHARVNEEDGRCGINRCRHMQQHRRLGAKARNESDLLRKQILDCGPQNLLRGRARKSSRKRCGFFCGRGAGQLTRGHKAPP